MSDEKALLEEEKEEMGLTKNDPSSMEEEEEEMAEEKPAVERSDRGELSHAVSEWNSTIKVK